MQGTVAKCTLPTLTCSFTLKVSTFPKEEVSVNSKLVGKFTVISFYVICNYCNVSVSQDRNIEQLISEHPVDVVISSGGLQRILDNTDFLKRWDIPVIIKEIELMQGYFYLLFYFSKILVIYDYF